MSIDVYRSGSPGGDQGWVELVADRGGQSLGWLVRDHRIRTGLTQTTVAGRSGVGVRTLRDIERGAMVRPHPETVERIARGLGLDGGRRAQLLALAKQARAAADVAIGVLGPLQIFRDGVVTTIGADKLRRLLGLLAVQAGRVTGIEEIVDALWEGRPPRTYRALIHEYAARLRAALGSSSRPAAGLVRSARGGYWLEVSGAQLDVLCFEELRSLGMRARAQGDLPRAQQLLGESLHCWRGPVLADVGGRLPYHPAATAITNRRLSTAVAYGDIALERRDYVPAVEHLSAVASADPLDEAVHARLMLALAGTGHEAAAVRLYTQVRARLAEELGLDPGPHLRAAYERVVRRDGSAVGGRPDPVRPAQLPADVADFTGRDAELDCLSALLEAGHPSGLSVLVVTGAPGVGKTALAVHWAHMIAGRYPDGQLFVDLRGYSADPPLRPLDALRHMLIGCAVPAGRVPHELQTAVGMYRSQLYGKRMLVILDNAASADQVRPLLAGGGGSLVVVTSRDRLAGLAATSAARVSTVDALAPGDAVALLGKIIGQTRVSTEPAAALELAELCGRLPLAIRVAASDLAATGGTVADHVRDLSADRRIGRLAVPGDLAAGVAAAFDLSYTRLSPRQQRLFRLAAMAPGDDMDASAAAMLLGCGPGEAAALLDDLARAHLVERVHQFRFRLHDLLRLYGCERARQEDSDAVREAALCRLLAGQTRRAAAAARMLHPQVGQLPDGRVGADDPTFTSHAQALAWLDSERANLVSAVRLAAARSWPVAGHLADALRAYLEHRRHMDDWLTVAAAGLAAATSAGQARVAAACQMSLAVAHGALGRFGPAREHFCAVLAGAQANGWPDVEAVALNNLGVLCREAGELDRAIDFYERALLRYRGIGWPAGHGTCLANLGSAYFARGMLDESLRYQQDALAMGERAGAPGVAALALEHLGRTYGALGSQGNAADCLGRALRGYVQVGNRLGEASVLALLAAAHLDGGRHEAARQHADEALALSTATDNATAQVSALVVLAGTCLGTGEPHAARRYAARAVRVAVDRHRPFLEVQARLQLARTQDVLGQPRQALRSATRSLDMARRCGYRVWEGHARTFTSALAAGDPGASDDAVVQDVAGALEVQVDLRVEGENAVRTAG